MFSEIKCACSPSLVKRLHSPCRLPPERWTFDWVCENRHCIIPLHNVFRVSRMGLRCKKWVSANNDTLRWNFSHDSLCLYLVMSLACKKYAENELRSRERDGERAAEWKYVVVIIRDTKCSSQRLPSFAELLSVSHRPESLLVTWFRNFSRIVAFRMTRCPKPKPKSIFIYSFRVKIWIAAIFLFMFSRGDHPGI